MTKLIVFGSIKDLINTRLSSMLLYRVFRIRKESAILKAVKGKAFRRNENRYYNVFGDLSMCVFVIYNTDFII